MEKIIEKTTDKMLTVLAKDSERYKEIIESNKQLSE
jgi:hypothetical protein